MSRGDCTHRAVERLQTQIERRGRDRKFGDQREIRGGSGPLGDLGNQIVRDLREFVYHEQWREILVIDECFATDHALTSDKVLTPKHLSG